MVKRLSRRSSSAKESKVIGVLSVECDVESFRLPLGDTRGHGIAIEKD